MATTTRRNCTAHNDSDVWGELVSLISGFRAELAALLVLAAGWLALTRELGRIGGSIVLGLGVIILVAWGRTRRGAWNMFVRSSWRRRVDRASIKLARALRWHGIPYVRKVTVHAAGFVVVLKLPAGCSATTIMKATDHFAVALRVAAVRARRGGDRADLLEIEIVRGSSFGMTS